jgi:hypothetical protein
MRKALARTAGAVQETAVTGARLVRGLVRTPDIVTREARFGAFAASACLACATLLASRLSSTR